VIRSNHIKDCPVTCQDINVAIKIWGKNIAALKGKTTRSNMNPVARVYVKLPMESLKLNEEVFITTDIFFVNKISFFLTLSHKICFTAVNHLVDRTVPQFFKAFKEMYQSYLQQGFHVTKVHTYGEFAVDLVSANEHVPKIECIIRVVKERCRATRHGLPLQGDTEALDDPHCAQCCQTDDFISD
jgi:hypothetical protein